MRLVEEGRYRPTVGTAIGFDEIPETLRRFERREILGRVAARIA